MGKDNSIIKIIVYIVIVILLLLIVIGTNKQRESTVGETVLSYTVMPIQRGFSYLANWISNVDDFFPQIEQLKKENENLKSENEKIKNSFVNYELLYKENQMLKEQLNLKEKYPEFNTLVADVIADHIDNWNKIIVLNQGENDGVKVGMTVVSEKGLVGYVKEVKMSSCKVLCVTDSGNSVSCRLSKTKEAVICKGETNLENEYKLKMKYIPTDVVVSVGDLVETSGLGGMYKKGVNVGEIVEVVESSNNLESYAIVKTAVDFSTLEYALIILE